MTFEIRLLVVTLAAFAAASLVAGALVPVQLRRLRTATPADRARRLLRLRFYPVTVALAASALAAGAFLVYEQREYLESTGVLLRVLAALALVFWLAAIERGIRLAVATRRIRQRWLAAGRPLPLHGAAVEAVAVPSAFPIVAVVGVWRPRLVIAESVLAVCSPAELRAIIDHENRHVRTRDNLRRVLMTLAPDALAWLPLSRRLRTEWNDAIEEAADDAAAGVGMDGRLRLAEALLRVARLGTSPAPVVELPASALFRGESVERRVRRLLEPAAPAARGRQASWTAFVAAGALVAAGLSLDVVHQIVELGVRLLP